MKKKNLLAITMIIPMLFACNNKNDDSTPPERTPLSVKAGIISGYETPSRASDQTWNQGDAIGIYTLATGTETINENESNLKYTNTSADGSSATFVPADAAKTAFYPTDGSKVDVMSYYPYTASVGTSPELIPVDVTNQTTLSAIDLMTAEKVVGKSKDEAEVDLSFVHRLTKLSITIEKHPSVAHIDLTGAKLTILGTPGTAVYDLSAQNFESLGNNADIALTVSADGTESTAIVIPTSANNGVSFRIEADGRTFKCPLPTNITLGTGEEAIIEIKLISTELATIKATIQPWAGGPTGSTEAYQDIMAEANELSLPGQGEVEIVTGNLATVYIWNNNGLSPKESPIYWKDLAYGTTHNFDLTYTPDTGTPAKDIIKGQATDIAWGAKIDFGNVYHVNSQLTVSFTMGVGYDVNTWDSEIAGATLSLEGFSTEPYQIPMSDKTAVVEPVDLTDTHQLKLTMGGFTYAMKLSEAFANGAKFEEGKTYALEATVSKASMGSIKIDAITDWIPGGTGTGDFEY